MTNEALQEIKTMRERLDRLEAGIKAKADGGRWVPGFNGRYYYPAPDSEEFCDVSTWENDTTDEHRLRAGMVFRTPEEAAEVGKQMYYQRWYRRFGDWDGKGEALKAFYHEDKIKTRTINHYDESTYFSSESACRAAIDEIGEGNFLRYVLGVRE